MALSSILRLIDSLSKKLGPILSRSDLCNIDFLTVQNFPLNFTANLISSVQVVVHTTNKETKHLLALFKTVVSVISAKLGFSL